MCQKGTSACEVHESVSQPYVKMTINQPGLQLLVSVYRDRYVAGFNEDHLALHTFWATCHSYTANQRSVLNISPGSFANKSMITNEYDSIYFTLRMQTNISRGS